MITGSELEGKINFAKGQSLEDFANMLERAGWKTYEAKTVKTVVEMARASSATYKFVAQRHQKQTAKEKTWIAP